MKYGVTTTLGFNVEEGYVIGLGQYPEGSPFAQVELNLDDYDLSGERMFAYKLKHNRLEFDEDKYQEVLAEREQKLASKPLDAFEKLQAQILYTALKTDTLILEEE